MVASGNNLVREGLLLREGLRQLQRRLPPDWQVSDVLIEPQAQLFTNDASVKVTAPDRRSTELAFEVKSHLEPRGAVALVERARAHKTLSRGAFVVISEYLSPSTREKLREGDLNYLDLTGNVRIVVPKPGLFIETQGANEDPEREERPVRSLRGPKAGRLVRTLVDTRQPLGVRELAAVAKIDAGYVSRILTFLDSEALVTRVGRGRLQSVDWPALLHRWAQDAPLESRGQVRTWLEPRGLSALLARLGKSKEKYAVTGSLAAAQLAPTAPARLATVWVRDASEAAARLGLRPADAGANVLLLEPEDDSVFERAVQRDGVWYAAPSQVAADLLTSPGRGPAEGEELIRWMKANEEAWRG